MDLDSARDVPKAIHVVGLGKVEGGVERLADSTGDAGKKRIRFFEEDTTNRYAVAYQAISHQPKGDVPYIISNPLKALYWAPLKIECGGEEKWVLVNKASLHKRFGLSYKEIDDHAAEGDLSVFVEIKAEKKGIQEKLKKYLGTPDSQYRGKFVTKGASYVSRDFSPGMVKDR